MRHLAPILVILVLLSPPAHAQHRHRKVRIITSYGTMVILLSDETPHHRDNFIKLVRARFYDSLLFHRVIPGFMIQGGDPDSRRARPGQELGNGDVGYTIAAEFRSDLFHRKGVLAAARDNNPLKASSGCQFYIVEGKIWTDSSLDQLESKNHLKFSPEQRAVYKTEGGTPWLDQNYTVFGQLIKGMDVLDRIDSVKTDSHDRPLKDVRMKIRLVHKFLLF
ncbi:MAG TPA: peptidylprolyl isomerase [Chitinophagaceae bacterium]|nr:peptidylprolyl isomerase [Chitinophagaceae bacterium]